MDNGRMTFYLAGSWARRAEGRGIAARIERETGGVCVARWLDSTRDDSQEKDRMAGARECLEDIEGADRLVVLAGDNTSPGKHTEMGFALAFDIPVHLVEAPWSTKRQRVELMDKSVFYYLADSVTDLDAFIRAHKPEEAEQ